MLQFVLLLPGFYIPNPCGPILACGHYQASIVVESDGRNRFLVALQLMYKITVCRVPQTSGVIGGTSCD